jgi:hypothetical protein
MSVLSSICNRQTLEHGVLTDVEGALLEHGPYLMREPITQLGAACDVGNTFNVEADFGKGDNANEQQIEGLPRDKVEDLRIRFWTSTHDNKEEPDAYARHVGLASGWGKQRETAWWTTAWWTTARSLEH